MIWKCWTGAFVVGFALTGAAQAQALKPEQINEAKIEGKAASEKAAGRGVAARLQILLDRARFSPGVIDGRMGENVENALAAFRKQHKLEGKGNAIDEATWAKLSENGGDRAIVEYTITEEDVKGPFTKNIPEGFEDKKDLERLAYTGPAELLTERFHMDEDFLKELNPDKDFSKAGTAIMVANVEEKREKPERGAVRRIEVDKGSKQLRAFGEGDRLLVVFPATIGSKQRPAPTGEHTVKGVAQNPKYTYNPEYKFEGVKTDKPFTIAPGPNNPVGSVWIDLSEEGYGIHGTPEPSEIGKTASHGCVRLTNWDANTLAQMVKTGVTVKFM